jgi:NDP-sugar pyrophosphorylase family protein
MAGGKGTRLMPRTSSVPKPMIEVFGKPILEHIILRANREGFIHFFVAIHHLGEVIEKYFGDGSQLGVKISYLREETPLGTAGALSLLNDVNGCPLIVMNADVLTDVSLVDMMKFHHQHQATATMAVQISEWQNPYGVIQTQGIDIVAYEEKPIIKSLINAGVYLLNPQVLDLLERKQHLDMLALFELIHSKNWRVIAYPVYEKWLDLGSPEQLESVYRENPPDKK